MDNFSLSSHFSRYFSICIANTPKLKEEVFRIRYQVYCEELGYEPLSKFPDHMERDLYDSRAIHCLLQHTPSGLYAGCVRLVLSDSHNPDAKFPFENVCSDHLIDFNELGRSHFGEVSRLAVISQFRKREGEQKTPGGLIKFDDQQQEQGEQRRSPVIALSLYLAAIGLLVTFEFDYGLTLMEPRLARHLRMVGILSRPIGKAVEFHGKRGPFILNTSEIVQNFPNKPEIDNLFRNIQASIGGEFSYNFRIA